MVGDDDGKAMTPEEARKQFAGEKPSPQELEQEVKEQDRSAPNGGQPEEPVRSNYTDYPLEWDTSFMPSRGQLYDYDVIHAHPISVKEEKYLTTSNLLNFEEAVRQVGQNCLEQDFLDLTYGDKLWAYIRLRIETWSSTYYMAWTCNKCDHENSRYEYDLNEMDVTRLPEDYTEPQSFSVEDGREITMRMLRVRDEVAVDNFLDQEKGNNQNQQLRGRNQQQSSFGSHSRDQLEVLSRLASMIEKCPGDASTIKSTVHWLENDATQREFALVRSFADKYYHGLSFEAELECHNCGRVTQTMLPFRPQLLYPDPDEIVSLEDARTD
jgi:hypothetical protein